jgi:fatty-acyl-CoA synthase
VASSSVRTRATNQTIASRLDAVAEDRPDSPAAWFPGRRLTYAELSRASLDAARCLRASQVGSGDRVALLLSRASPEYLAIILGCMRLGAIAVCINARYKSGELDHVLLRTTPKLLCTDSRAKHVLDTTAVPDDSRVVVIEAENFLDPGTCPVAPDEVSSLEHQVDPAAAARIIFTSGTTAYPKGCMHSQSAMLAQGALVADRLELTKDDRFWTPLPLFHTAGWSTMLAAQARGACFHHVGFFEPGAALDQIVEERCTVLFPGFETIWMAVLEHPRFDPANLSHVRLVINVGVYERMQVMQRLLPSGPQVSNTGSTEACGFLAIGRANDPPRVRLRTAGAPLPGVEVRIVDPATGADVPDGTPGELLFQGVCRLLGYYGDAQADTEAIDPDGWFHSGDLMCRDTAGNLEFISRLKDMLKVGGENVAAAEIESLLLSHPGVKVAHVVAAPDARYGEVAAAFVQVHDRETVTEKELIEFCVGKIATFKVPRYVRFVDEWPMSSTTKIKKNELRTRIASELERLAIREAAPIRTNA